MSWWVDQFSSNVYQKNPKNADEVKLMSCWIEDLREENLLLRSKLAELSMLQDNSIKTIPENELLEHGNDGFTTNEAEDIFDEADSSICTEDEETTPNLLLRARQLEEALNKSERELKAGTFV